MDKTEKLKKIILDKYSSIREFSKIVGIPSTTLTSSLDRGIGGMAVDRVIKICDTLNIDIRTFEPQENIIEHSTQQLSLEEEQHIEQFRKLNIVGRKKVTAYTNDLIDSGKYEKSAPIPITKKKDIWEEEGKEHLMPIACHDDNLTEEEKAQMDKIINDYFKNNRIK